MSDPLPEPDEVEKALKSAPEILKYYVAELLKKNQELLRKNAKMKVDYEMEKDELLTDCDARIEKIKNPKPVVHLHLPAGKAAGIMPTEPPEKPPT